MGNQRGGRRPGAGRKALPGPIDPGLAARVLARKFTASDGKTLSEEDWWFQAIWIDGDQDRQLRARIYLTDRRDGKPVQAIQHTTDKPIDINVTIRRVGAKP